MAIDFKAQLAFNPDAVAFDTETHLSQPGLAAPPLVCGSIADRSPGSERVLDRASVIHWFRDAIRTATLVGAWIVYDMGVMSVAAPDTIPDIFKAYEAGRIKDVLNRQKLGDLGRGHMNRLPDGNRFKDPETGKFKENYSLAIVAWLNLGVTMAKEDTWRKRYATLEHTPINEWPHDALEYPKADARQTFDVYEAQKDFLNLRCENALGREAWALHLSTLYGMRTDPVEVARVSERISKQHAEDVAFFTAHGFYRGPKSTIEVVRKRKAGDFVETVPCPEAKWGTKDTKKIKDRVVAAYKGNAPMTDGDGVSLSKDTLLESADPLLERLGECSGNEKLFATYLPLLEQGTRVPINPYADALMETWRSSYSSPNLQNLPRKGGIRECFVPRPGFWFGEVDYSTVELRTLAQCCIWLLGESKMADALNAKQDLHTRLAARMARRDYSEMLAAVKAGEKAASDLRQFAKIGNFGFPGLMGPDKLVLNARKDGIRFCTLAGVATECSVEMSETWDGKPICAACQKVAQELKAEWAEEWSEMPDYFERVKGLTNDFDGGDIVSFGNGMVRGNCGREACNHFFQNLAAQIAKHSLWLVSRECYTDPDSALWGTRPVVFVHDSIMSEMPCGRASRAIERKSALMIQAAKRFCPDIHFETDCLLMERWYKGAKPVRIDGELVPWRPKELPPYPAPLAGS